MTPKHSAPLTVEAVPELVGRMSVEQKAALCSGSDFWRTEGLEELGIPSVMVTDGPHGLRKQAGETDHVGLNESVPATCFPAAVGLGSTWDSALIEKVGTALGVETRVNDVAVLLGPGINLKRSPLCGRNFEYFSEDPYLTAEMSVPLVQGIQAEGVGTSLKHFAMNNQETERMRVSVEVDDRTMREMYLAAFEQVVQRTQPWTVMCSYNKIRGTYASENHWLLTDVLRDQWGYEGVVVSDWGAVNDRVKALAAGLDLEMPGSQGINDARIVEAVKNGTLDEAVLDTAATRILTLLAKAAEDPRTATEEDLPVEAHHALARKAAAAVAVLLKNQGEALPLDENTDFVVIGELARTPRYQGAGSSQVNPTNLVSLLDALEQRGKDAPFAPGYPLEKSPTASADRDELLAEATSLARDKVAVVVVGLPPSYESEGYDRTDIFLPEEHIRLVNEVAQVSKETIVLLANGSAVATRPWEDQVEAVLELWLGGQAGGAGAADLLFGDVSPTGRLAESIPVQLDDLPAQLNFPGERGVVRYGEGPFIGYRGLDAMKQEVSYPFGHGLTYTTFDFSNLNVEVAKIAEDTDLEEAVLRVSVTVTNTGNRSGRAVPQLYVGRPESALIRPPRELKGFAGVELGPGESQEVTFEVSKRWLSTWDEDRQSWWVEAGPAIIEVGASSRDLPLSITVDIDSWEPTAVPNADSSINTWLAYEPATEELFGYLGDFGKAFLPETYDAETVNLLGQTPLRNLPTMGFVKSMSPEDFERFLEKYEHPQ